jgi:hypothetical protein
MRVPLWVDAAVTEVLPLRHLKGAEYCVSFFLIEERLWNFNEEVGIFINENQKSKSCH